tara:strand:- start:22 stop:192 length:171 start_codon:yes stop_codon:yes gene_type:complete
MNWNSKTKDWTEIRNLSLVELANKAKKLKENGMSVKSIAKVLGKSESRIREYLLNK